MLSRVASSIYWIGRYIERAENYARIIDVNRNLTLDMPDELLSEKWEPVIYATGEIKNFLSRYDSYDRNSVIKFMLTDTANPNSIISCIMKARENALSVQNEINLEMWITINDMYHFVKEHALKRNWGDEPLNEFLTSIMNYSLLFIGIMDSTYSHTQSWQFAYIGRMLERADKTARVIDTKHYYLKKNTENSTTLELIQWRGLLTSVSAYEMFSKKFPRMNLENIIRFLLLDKEFPRAVNYSVSRAERALHVLTENQFLPYTCEPERVLGRLRSQLDFTDENEILAIGLHHYLIELENRIFEIGETIDKHFF